MITSTQYSEASIGLGANLHTLSAKERPLVDDYAELRLLNGRIRLIR
jgi:hypothetical protein